MADSDLFKPDQGIEGEPPRKKLPMHQTCVLCQRELRRHEWAKPGNPGVCDNCARGAAAR